MCRTSGHPPHGNSFISLGRSPPIFGITESLNTAPSAVSLTSVGVFLQYNNGQIYNPSLRPHLPHDKSKMTENIINSEQTVRVMEGKDAQDSSKQCSNLEDGQFNAMAYDEATRNTNTVINPSSTYEQPSSRQGQQGATSAHHHISLEHYRRPKYGRSASNRSALETNIPKIMTNLLHEEVIDDSPSTCHSTQSWTPSLSSTSLSRFDETTYYFCPLITHV